MKDASAPSEAAADLAGALADAAAFLHEQREREIAAHANGARQ
jgi:hypothetical protein